MSEPEGSASSQETSPLHWLERSWVPEEGPTAAHIRGAEALLRLVDLPPARLEAPTRRPNENDLTRALRAAVAEYLNVRLEYRPFSTIDGILVAWRGHRLICLNVHNNPQHDVHLCLHILGHLALGHVDDRDLVVRYEYADRSLEPSAVEEQEASRWAQHFSRGRRVRVHNPRELPRYSQVTQTIRLARVQRGWLRRLIHRSLLWMRRVVPGYGRVRSLDAVDAVVERVAWLVGYTR